MVILYSFMIRLETRNNQIIKSMPAALDTIKNARISNTGMVGGQVNWYFSGILVEHARMD